MQNGFTVDTDGLRDAAKKTAALGKDLEDTRHLLGKAANHPEAFSGGEGPGRLFEELKPRFEEACHYLGRVLSDNAENLELSAKALREVAHRYDENEHRSAKELGQ